MEERLYVFDRKNIKVTVGIGSAGKKILEDISFSIFLALEYPYEQTSCANAVRLAFSGTVAAKIR